MLTRRRRGRLTPNVPIRPGERRSGHTVRGVSYADGVTEPEYDDIPGTFVFDGRRSRQGYWLNMFCMSLRDEANREAFRADEAKYLDGFAVTDEQRRAILDRDWLRMLELGGNV